MIKKDDDDIFFIAEIKYKEKVFDNLGLIDRRCLHELSKL